MSETLGGGQDPIEVPKLPADRLALYVGLLGNPDDFQPVVRNSIISVGTQNFRSIDETKAAVLAFRDTSDVVISLPYPTHSAGIHGLVLPFAYHLNFACTGKQYGDHSISFESSINTVLDYNQEFPNNALPVHTDEHLNNVYPIFAYWKQKPNIPQRAPVITFRADYSVKNANEYALHSDQVFFGTVYNEIRAYVTVADEALIQLVMRFFLAGFPEPQWDRFAE